MTDAAGVVVLLLSLALLSVRRIDTAIRLGAGQALFAAAASGAPATAVAVLVLNGAALPLAMARLDPTPDLTARGHGLVAWMAALAVLLAVIAALARVGPGEIVAIGASVTLLGLLLIALRANPLAPALGLLSAQNGLVLVASANADLPISATLAVAVPLIPALVLADLWLRR